MNETKINLQGNFKYTPSKNKIFKLIFEAQTWKLRIAMIESMNINFWGRHFSSRNFIDWLLEWNNSTRDSDVVKFPALLLRFHFINLQWQELNSFCLNQNKCARRNFHLPTLLKCNLKNHRKMKLKSRELKVAYVIKTWAKSSCS